MSKTIGDFVSDASLRAVMGTTAFVESQAVSPSPEMFERIMRIKLPSNVRISPIDKPAQLVWNDNGQAIPAVTSLIHLGPESIDPVAMLQAMIDAQAKKASQKQHVFCPLWILFQRPDGGWMTRSAWVTL